MTLYRMKMLTKISELATYTTRIRRHIRAKLT